jgi:hypothetical protein
MRRLLVVCSTALVVGLVIYLGAANLEQNDQIRLLVNERNRLVAELVETSREQGEISAKQADTLVRLEQRIAQLEEQLRSAGIEPAPPPSASSLETSRPPGATGPPSSGSTTTTTRRADAPSTPPPSPPTTTTTRPSGVCIAGAVCIPRSSP